MRKLISIIAPMYNEQDLVHEYCKEAIKMIDGLIERYDFEVILVNDGSKDDTYLKMNEEQVRYPEFISIVNLSRNFGLEGAVNAGLSKADGDAVVVMDADLQDPLELIPVMIEKWENGADVVVGSRVKRSKDSLFKKLGAGVYYRVLDNLSGKLKLEKSAANYRLLSRHALNELRKLPEVNSVFRVVVPYIGMKTDVVEYDRDKRYAGTTKYNLKSMIPYALDSITGISIQPLRKIPYLLVINTIIFILAFIGAFVFKASMQYICIGILAMSIIGGMILAALCIIAEYLAQVVVEVKGRPISIIYEYKPRQGNNEYHNT